MPRIEFGGVVFEGWVNIMVLIITAAQGAMAYYAVVTAKWDPSSRCWASYYLKWSQTSITIGRSHFEDDHSYHSRYSGDTRRHRGGLHEPRSHNDARHHDE